MSDDADAPRFGAVEEQYDPGAVEERVFAHWETVSAYERTVEHRSDGNPYFFVDGPPYTSGAAHMGTTWNKILKDCYIRYLRMQGHDVSDRPGYDMHGLPIETRVEEQLGFENKKDIEAYGEENFIEACKEYANEQLEGLQADFQSFGVWMDWDDPYKTVDPSYMEAAWWGFAHAHERGLVEQGKRSISQCPRCETAIANNEVEYADVEDPSIYVTFPLVDREGALVIWTTTPWTIPANTFVAVDEDGRYLAVDATKDGEVDRLYIAEPKVEAVLSAGRYADYEVVDELSGADMVGWAYEHPLDATVPAAPDGEGAREVYTADYVETDGEGTGLVHSAPGHGEVDFLRGQELGLDPFCPVGPDGVFEEAGGAYAGEFVKDADATIIEELDAEGHLLAEETTTHSYGHCWRCDTGIVQIVTDQWFITITDIKDELLDNIGDSEWYPGWARDNRFRDFVEDAPDWNVSRQRYWGIPIPIWIPQRDTDGESVTWSGTMDDAIVIGDRESLAERVDQDINPETVDLHKDTVDELTITEDGVVYERVPDVFDVWLDSSVATWGTIDFPAEREAFEELWPADLILEAHDQTRGWFWSQLGMGTAAVGDIPYERVLMHGFANMPDGRSMSKSKDIFIDPHEVIDEYGVDPMRLFLLSVSSQGVDMNFSWDETAEMQRRLNIVWNVARFPLPYMRADDFDPDAVALVDVAEDLETVDRWVLSRLQTVETSMTDAMDDFENDAALDALLEFIVEDVSRFYVQVVRERMWEAAESPSKRAAYATLYTVLEESMALLAPFAPFVAEELYGVLTGDGGHPTVHMADWPEPDVDWHEPALEDDISIVREVEVAGSAARQQAERSLRWPVERVVVAAPSDRVVDALEAQRDLLADRLNARSVRILGPDETWSEVTFAAEADMSELGPAFGDDAGRIMSALNEAQIEQWDLDRLEDAVAEATGLDVELRETMVTPVQVVPDDVSHMDFAVETGTGDEYDAVGGRVYVDARLTEALESEGYAREVIRRIQQMRKDLELDIEEAIQVDLAVDDDRVGDLVREHEDLIAEEVRAAAFGAVADAYRKTWEIEEVTVEIAITPTSEAKVSD